MNKILKTTLENAFKPFDIVRTVGGEIAFINTVSLNSCQKHPSAQVSYSLTFITENLTQEKIAWYDNDELELVGNIFIKIAEASAGREYKNVSKLFNNMQHSRGLSWED